MLVKKKKIFILIIISIILIVTFYNYNIQKNYNFTQVQLSKHYVSIDIIASYIERYCMLSEQDEQNSRSYFEYLLQVSREFEVVVSTYKAINNSYSQNMMLVILRNL